MVKLDHLSIDGSTIDSRDFQQNVLGFIEAPFGKVEFGRLWQPEHAKEDYHLKPKAEPVPPLPILRDVQKVDDNETHCHTLNGLGNSQDAGSVALL